MKDTTTESSIQVVFQPITKENTYPFPLLVAAQSKTISHSPMFPHPQYKHILETGEITYLANEM